MRPPAHFLAVDWGSTRVRAELWREDALVGAREAAEGVLRTAPADCEAVLAELCGDWIDGDPDLPVVLSGMVGAREGWRELPHLPLPAGVAELAAGLTALPSLRWPGRILGVPGLRNADPADLMRGEEVQVLGAGMDGCLCLPGTHSKWVVVQEGRVVAFRTFLTGELHGALCGLGSYRAFAPAPGDGGREAFLAGFAAAGDLLHDLFQLRIAGLQGAGALGERLAGLLVGHELRAALVWAPPGEVALVGAEALCERYAWGLEALGRQVRRVPGGSHARGVARLLAGKGGA